MNAPRPGAPGNGVPESGPSWGNVPWNLREFLEFAVRSPPGLPRSCPGVLPCRRGREVGQQVLPGLPGPIDALRESRENVLNSSPATLQEYLGDQVVGGPIPMAPHVVVGQLPLAGMIDVQPKDGHTQPPCQPLAVPVGEGNTMGTPFREDHNEATGFPSVGSLCGAPIHGRPRMGPALYGSPILRPMAARGRVKLRCSFPPCPGTPGPTWEMVQDAGRSFGFSPPDCIRSPSRCSS